LSPKSSLAGLARLHITEPTPTCVTCFAQFIRFHGVQIAELS
jgi:ATP-dependent phosphoenolpyruvate carboxykinase